MGMAHHVMIMWSQCDEDNLLMTLPDVDQVMMQQGAAPVMSQDYQLTPDQSVTVCRQLQQVTDV